MTWSMFFQCIVNGLLLGSMYALLAVGYSVVYGILGFINFAHGGIFMIAIYLAIYANSLFLLPWPASFTVSILLTAILGVLVDRVAYKPLRKAPKLSNFISAIGVAFLLENCALLLFGGRPKPFVVVPETFLRSYSVVGIHVPSMAVYGMVATTMSLSCLYYLVYRTKPGLAMRALSEDLEVAGLMGINVDRIISMGFAVGSGLAGVGAILWGLRFPVASPTVGAIPGIKAFIAGIIGGVGNIPGAVVGGFVLGLAEIMLVAFLPHFSGYRDVFSFLILVLILLFRPAGLLGAKELEQKM
jgi:branched-chain amino acid transport system permease protein